tara:strand:+ start:2575 stop:2757 length:183 start_codon:yes stop_codon:yes gene_type:complete
VPRDAATQVLQLREAKAHAEKASNTVPKTTPGAHVRESYSQGKRIATAKTMIVTESSMTT